MRRAFLLSLISLSYFTWPFGVSAHVTFTGAGDLFAGLVHPLSVPAHILVLAALGLLFGQKDKAYRIRMLPVFLTALIFGIFCGFMTGELPVLEWFLLSIATSLGIIVALDRRLPTTPQTILVGTAAFLIGLDSAPIDDLAWNSLLLISFGVIAGVLLILVNITLYSRQLACAQLRIGLRICGSWIAAASIMVLALLVR